MNHAAFSLILKAKYCWFSLPEVELIGMEVFTSRKFATSVISFIFTIFPRERNYKTSADRLSSSVFA